MSIILNFKMKDYEKNLFAIERICALDYKNPRCKIIIDDAVKYYAENKDVDSLNQIRNKVENYDSQDMFKCLLSNKYTDIFLKIFRSHDDVVTTLWNAKDSLGLASIFARLTNEYEEWNLGGTILSYLISLNDITALLIVFRTMTDGGIDGAYFEKYGKLIGQIYYIIFNNVTAKDAGLFHQVFPHNKENEKKFFQVADLKALAERFNYIFDEDYRYTELYFKRDYKRRYVAKIDSTLVNIVEENLRKCDVIDTPFLANFLTNFIIGYVANASSVNTYLKTCGYAVNVGRLACRDSSGYFVDSIYPANQNDLDKFEELFFTKCSNVNLLSEYAYYKTTCAYIKREDSINTIVKLARLILAKSTDKEILYFVKRLYLWCYSWVRKAFDIIGYDTIVLKIVEKQNIDYIYEIIKIFKDELSIDTLNTLKDCFIKSENNDYICDFCLIYSEFDLDLFNIFIKNAKPKQIYNYILSRYVSLSVDKIYLLFEAFLLNKSDDTAEYIYKIAKKVPSIYYSKLQEIMYALNLRADNEWLIQFEKIKKSCETNYEYQLIADSSNIAQTLLNKNKEFIKKFTNYLLDNMNINNNYYVLINYNSFFEENKISLEEAIVLDRDYVSLVDKQSESQNIGQNSMQRKLSK